MGNKLSQVDVEATKQEVYSYYPGLEQQLEMAFACHDVESAGVQSYDALEPVVRHLLMQYGLVEYVARFVVEENLFTTATKRGGTLDTSLVATELRSFDVDIRYPMDVEDFKNLTVVWLKKILNTYNDDQAEWAEKLRKHQEEQSAEYTKALTTFQEQYLHQQAVYQQGLEDQKKQINDWNRVLKEAERTQHQIYDSELERLQDIERRQQEVEENAAKEKQKLMAAYQESLKNVVAETEVTDPAELLGCGSAAKHTTSTNFTYPVSATPYGACASAGAQEPTRRMNRGPIGNRGKNKAFKACC